jgi:hypothetical protein
MDSHTLYIEIEAATWFGDPDARPSHCPGRGQRVKVGRYVKLSESMRPVQERGTTFISIGDE